MFDFSSSKSFAVGYASLWSIFIVFIVPTLSNANVVNELVPSRPSLEEASKYRNYGCPEGTHPQFGWSGNGWYLAACNSMGSESLIRYNLPTGPSPVTKCLSGAAEQAVYDWRGEFKGTICNNVRSGN